MPRPNTATYPRRRRTTGAPHGRPVRPINHRPEPSEPANYGVAAVSTGGATTIGPLRSQNRSIAVHRLAAALSIGALRHQDKALITAACKADPYCQHRDMSRWLSAMRSVEVPLNMYFGWHTPGSRWNVEATLTVLGGVEFDLIWRLPDQRIVIDELKVERMTLERTLQLRVQTERQLDAARSLWPDTFAGIRMCILSQRYARYWVTPDGQRRAWQEAPS